MDFDVVGDLAKKPRPTPEPTPTPVPTPVLGPAPLALVPALVLVLSIPVIFLLLRIGSSNVSRPTSWNEWLDALPRYITKGGQWNRFYIAGFATVILLLIVDMASYLNKSGFINEPWELVRTLVYLLAWCPAFGLLIQDMRSVDFAKHEVLHQESKAEESSAAAAGGSADAPADGNGSATTIADEIQVDPKKSGGEEEAEIGPPISSAWSRSVVPPFLLVSLLVDAYPIYVKVLPLISNGGDGSVDLFHLILFGIRYAVQLTLALVVLVSVVGRGHSGYQRLPDEESGKKEAKEEGVYRDFWTRMGLLMPFLWPSESLYLQFLVMVCFLLLIIGRVVNVLVPLQYKVVIDALTPSDGSDPSKPITPYFCWLAILVYTSLRFLQGGSGLVSSLQSYFWIPISQWTTRKVSVDAFAHLHSLSFSWHVSRKTGETLRVLDRGTSSIISLLQYVVFSIFPTLVDIGVAVIFFIVKFDWGFGLIVLATMMIYLVCTILITEWRTSFRKDMITLDNDARAMGVDSLLNFETVKYFSNEAYEVTRYDEAIAKYMKADYKSQASLNALNLSQNAIITLGLLAGCLLAAREVVDGTLTVGDFVMFLTYLTQLYVPLNFFGTLYRVIQQSFIDMEKLIDLFHEKKSVQDKPGAKDIVVAKGEVVFEDVNFSYDPRHPALRDVSFRIPAGKTVALVGHSGSGKTSITRLLFRFYDVNSGRVLIDGTDVRDVTQVSLRSSIGVVPQDTVLFNSSVMDNIRYGNTKASDDEVIEAAKAAQLHDRIMSFPDGYATKVGERGLRLSGGEKQVCLGRLLSRFIGS